MGNETLGQKIAKYCFCAYLGVASVVLPLTLGKMGNDRATADKKVVIKSPFFDQGDLTYYGFDRNKDGKLDEIVEYGGVVGPRFRAAPMRLTYTPENREFETLKQLFEK